MDRAAPPIDVIRRALAAYPDLGQLDAQARITPLSGGLINLTFAVETDARGLILQRVNPIFKPEIHNNIRAVSERLRERGEASPELLTSAAGHPWVDLGEGGIWRLMTRLGGRSYDTLDGAEGPARARSAGALIARFHGALRELDHTFIGLRTGVHDTPAHMAALRRALAQGEGAQHRLLPEVANLGAQILAAADALAPIPAQPAWVVHGDLKINNVLFAGQRAHALIDLDTVGRMPLWMELGDAWRSWCNPGGEDNDNDNDNDNDKKRARFDLDVFSASVDGYLSTLTDTGVQLRPGERRSLVHGVEWIALELAARFAADAIHESYFGWDRERFATAGEHNLLRARGQWSLFQAALETRHARAELLLAG